MKRFGRFLDAVIVACLLVFAIVQAFDGEWGFAALAFIALSNRLRIIALEDWS